MSASEWAGNWLIWFFTKTPLFGNSMALFLAGVLVGLSLFISGHYWWRHRRPLAAAINERIAVLQSALNSPTDAADAPASFARSFNSIDLAMDGSAAAAEEPLRRAWREYRETILDPAADTLQSAAHPAYFFADVHDRHRAIGWFANIFIALGLLITFLGIIAALSTLKLDGGAQQMQTTLTNLMQVAGAKFWASVGGIFGSIILRIYDYRATRKIDGLLNHLCSLLEQGISYVPPQRIAVDQLHELREQGPAIRAFSEQIAAALDGALTRQMAPMIGHLGSIQQGIEKISGTNVDAVQTAFTEATGTEMAGLANAIGAMTSSMTAMSGHFAEATGNADRQINEAVRRFGQASAEMRDAFAELKQHLGAIATQMQTDSARAGAETEARLKLLLDGFGGTLDGMKASLATAAEGLGAASASAASTAARLGQESMEAAFASFVSRFEQMGQPLVNSMGDAASAMSASSRNLASAEQAIGDHARAITEVAHQSDDIATAFGQVANDMAAATAPIEKSSQQIAAAAKAVETAVADSSQTSASTLDGIREMAASLRETAESANGAWADYRARFNDVDKSLADALHLLQEAVSSHAVHLNDYVGKVDGKLGEGVSKLAGALEPLTNLRDIVEELSDTITSTTRAAE